MFLVRGRKCFEQVFELLTALLDESGDEFFGVFGEQPVDFVEDIVDFAYVMYNGRVLLGEGFLLLDRKSTRLNSSH